jgi:aminotransferase
MSTVEPGYETAVERTATRYPFAAIRERLVAHPGEVLDFAIGRHVLTVPQPVKDLLERHPELAVKAAGRDEFHAFAESAVDMLARDYTVRTTGDCVLAAPGGRAAMNAMINALLEPGDGVLATEPGYPAFASLAAYRGTRVHSVPLNPDRSFTPDLRTVSDDAADGIRLAALNYPNNPTGALISDHLVAFLVERLGPGLMVFNDATYGPLTYGTQPRSFLADSVSKGTDAELIELHSFRKLFAVGPLAICFLAGPQRLIQKIRDFGEYAWPPLSSLQLRVAALCARDGDHPQKMRAFFGEQVERLRSVLVRIGFDPYPTPSGTYVLCRVPAAIGGQSVDGAEHAAAILFDTCGVAVVPWRTRHTGYLRFSALYEAEDLEALAGSAADLAVSTS